MNYHLIVDDKFLDGFIEDVDAIAPDKNLYYIQGEVGKLKYVKSLNINFVKSRSEFLEKELIPNLKEGDKVFIHWLTPDLYKSILEIPAQIKVGIFFWGGEITENPQTIFAKENYDYFSLKFYKKYKHPILNYFKFSYNPVAILRHLKRKVLFERKVLAQNKLKEKALNRLNYIFHWNPFDYHWIKKRYPNFNAELKYFFYGVGLDDNLSQIEQKESNQIVFWLGNSATISNNHLDAFKILSKFKNEDIIIYCPLSYGESVVSLYVKSVINEGKEIFGEKFIPITDFLPRIEYYKLFAKVDIVLMFHNRTQAAGNIFAFLKMEKKVFMKKQNTVFKLLRKNGFCVYDEKKLETMSFQNLHKIKEAKNENNIENILNLANKTQTIKDIFAE